MLMTKEELSEVLAARVHLLPDILRKSRADSTDKKYHGAFSRFCLPPSSWIGIVIPSSLVPVLNHGSRC